MVKKVKPTTRSFNDKMVGKTVLPAIYLWLLASGAVVAMGIWKPEVVLMNLDGFIALIAIIGGVAGPALNTVLRMWESEQQIEIDNMGVELEHERDRDTEQHAHIMHLEKSAQQHEQKMLEIELTKKIEGEENAVSKTKQK